MSTTLSVETLLGQLLPLAPDRRLSALQRACAMNPAWRERLPEIQAALAVVTVVPPAEASPLVSPQAMVSVLRSALAGAKGAER